MGKIKRARQKYHLKSSGSSNKSSKEAESVFNYDAACSLSLSDPNFKINISSKGGDLFKNVVIPSDIYKQKLPDESKQFDTTSVHSLKLKQGKGLSRKGQRLLKREAFLQKLEAGRKADKKKKDEFKRKATPIVGDMQPLCDALPTLEHLLMKTKTNVPKEKPRLSKSLKRQNAEMLQDINTYQQVLKNPNFTSDPFAAISTHLKLLLQSENAQQ